MWSRTYRATFTDLSRERLWDVWTDVDRWPSWQDDVEYARLDGDFARGASIMFKPKGGPRVRLELTEVEPPSSFTDVTRFPLATMLDRHELVEVDGRVEVRNTVSVEGPLAFLWRKLVADGVVESLPEQTARLVEYARRA